MRMGMDLGVEVEKRDRGEARWWPGQRTQQGEVHATEVGRSGVVTKLPGLRGSRAKGFFWVSWGW